MPDACGRDRHRLAFGPGPHEATAIQPLGEQAHPLAVVPQHLDQAAALAPEHEQVATVRIPFQRLLHQQRQAVEAAPHVRRAARQPHPHLRRQTDHRPSARSTRFSASSSTALSTRSRTPSATSTSILPPPRLCAETATAVKRTVAPRTAIASCRRQLWITLRPTPYCRDTSDTVAPGSAAALRMACFSSRLNRRRRRTARPVRGNTPLSPTRVTPVASELFILPDSGLCR